MRTFGGFNSNGQIVYGEVRGDAVLYNDRPRHGKQRGRGRGIGEIQLQLKTTSQERWAERLGAASCFRNDLGLSSELPAAPFEASGW